LNIIGISAFFHDSAASYVQDGEIVAAAEEERFTRKKHDASFPEEALKYCVTHLPKGEKVDLVVFYEKPFLKFDRLLETYLGFAPRGLRSFLHSFPLWTKEKVFLKQIIKRKLKKKWGYCPRLIFSEHHLSHAASCFYPSPFEKAAVLCLDGVGEWETTTLWLGENEDLQKLKSINFPHSLGLLYSTITAYLGFLPNNDEYKVMGLAPYGRARFSEVIKEELIDIKEDGSFRLNLEYFDFCTGLKMYNHKLPKLFKRPVRQKDEPLEPFHADIAASLQVVTEEVILKLVRFIADKTGQRNLCMAGGVALNCVANGKILKETPIEKIWIQPAAGDSGGALGAAFVGHFNAQMPKPKRVIGPHDSQKGSLLGPEFGPKKIEKVIEASLDLEDHVMDFSEWRNLCEKVAELLDEGLVGGLFQGRMEFGPRALGCRSIIADARREDGQNHINKKIKFREDFRPFAPIVLREDLKRYFNVEHESPYMLLVGQVAESIKTPLNPSDEGRKGFDQLGVVRSKIPAVTHVDGSARIQTVHPNHHPALYELLRAFKKRTGEGVLVNTSFNVKGEPIVCTPEDAIRCFYTTGLDFLVLDKKLIIKKRREE
jgi:carbamoyltransferase